MASIPFFHVFYVFYVFYVAKNSFFSSFLAPGVDQA
jgi:hypothetical protein